MLTRRHSIAILAGAAMPASPAPGAPLIDTHIHLFEPEKFPYHANATYKPPAAPLARYLDFAREAGIDHVIVVHPEPYQDDHAYLEHCFANERPRGLFKGTCLFDPIDPKTPARMEALVKAHPGRIVALRIHAMNTRREPPQRSGAIRNRDLGDPALKKMWAKAGDLGLAVQMHFLPHHAPAIGRLAAEFRDVPVILDHMGRAGQGSPAEADGVLKLAEIPKVHLKYSGWSYFTEAEMKPFLRRAVQAFGNERIVWGGLGHNMEDHRKAAALFDDVFAFADDDTRARIRGRNAAALFRF